MQCNCEHISHNGKIEWDGCPHDTSGGAYCDYVGNVCAHCATHCVPEHIIWPTPVPYTHSVWEVRADAIPHIPDTLPRITFPERTALSERTYVLATRDEIDAIHTHAQHQRDTIAAMSGQSPRDYYAGQEDY